MMKLDYLTSGGDPTWLNGLQFTTQKIRNLAKLNGLMAHQPWLLKPRHIQELVCRESNHNPHNVWTISELAQAVVILATVHSISMFVAACGIVPEIDMVGGTFVDLSKAQLRKNQDETVMSPLTMLPSPRSDLDTGAKSPQAEGSSLTSEQQQERVTAEGHFSLTLPLAPVTKRTYDEETSKMHTAELIKRLMADNDSCCTEGEDAESEAEAGQDPSYQNLPPGFEEIEDSMFEQSGTTCAEVIDLASAVIIMCILTRRFPFLMFFSVSCSRTKGHFTILYSDARVVVRSGSRREKVATCPGRHEPFPRHDVPD